MVYEIISVGSAVIDAFVESDAEEKEGKIFFPVGRKLLVRNLGFATGGGGTNCAAAFSKFGLKTGFLGKVGNDENGKEILAELKKLNVSFLGKAGKEPTGFSIILDSKFRDRTVLTYRGANESLEFSELNLPKLKTNFFYFATMNDVSLETERKLSLWARQKKIKIFYNPDSHIILRKRKQVLEILKRCEAVFLNEQEAKDLVGRNDKECFAAISKLGPKIVSVTYGEHGAKTSDGNNFYEMSVNKVPVVERTGAGDAFASGFVAGLVKTGEIATAVRLGGLNSESVIQEKGAKKGLLSWKEAQRNLNKIKLSISQL